MSPKNRRGYEIEPPQWVEAKRATVYDRTPSGRAKSWRDPVTGAVWSDYQRRTALHGYLTPRQVTAARKAIGTKKYDKLTKTRGEGGTAPRGLTNHAQLVAGWAKVHGQTNAQAVADPRYWKAVDRTVHTIQAASRLAMSARRWSIESAFPDPDDAWTDPYFREYILDIDKHGDRKRFADIDEDIIETVFDDYDRVEDEFYDLFGFDVGDWEQSGGSE